MGYPAEISGADSDPVMQAIRAKFAQQATGAPTQMLPEHVRAAAQAAVLARNGNAKASALNSQVQAMHADPAVMQMIMETYGPDMAAQYAGGGNGAVQQPQAIQRAIPTAAETPIAEAAEGISSSPQEEVAEANSPLNAGMPTGQPPVAPATQGPAPSGMDPALAAALGFGGGVAGGVAGGYAAGRMINRQPAAPQMRGAVAGDFDAQMPPPAATKMPPAAAAPPPVDPKMQAAVMGTPDAPMDMPVTDPYDPGPQPMDAPEPARAAAPAPDAIDESGIPDHMRSDVDNRSAPKGRKYAGMTKESNAQDSHMRSIIMEMQGADTTPTGSQTAADAIATPEPEAAAPKGKRKSAKAKDATGAEGEAPKKRGRKAKAEPNAEGGTDYVHRDAETAKEAIKKSKAKAAEPAPAPAEESLAAKVDKVAAESAPVETPKQKRGPKARKTDKAAKKTEAAAPVDDRMPEQPKPELRKSRLDTPTNAGAKASKGMTLAEAKELVKAEPDLKVIDKFEAYDMNDEQFNALKEEAKNVIRAAKGAAPGNPKKAKTAANAEQTFQESKDQRTVYTYDDKNEAILKAMKEPIVQRRPQRAKDANSELLRTLARKRK